MTLVVGLYDTLPRAQGAVEDLIDSGFPHEAVSVLLSGSTANATDMIVGDGSIIVSATGRRRTLIVAGPLAASFRAHRADGHDRVPDVLCAAGLSLFAATYFNEAICDGGVLVTVQCDEGLVRNARDILDTHAPDGFDECAVPLGEHHPAGTPAVHLNGKEHQS